MRRVMFAILILAACSPPILERQLSEKAFLNVPLDSMVQYPHLYRGDLYLLGGKIIGSKKSERGLLIEALYIPADGRGYIKDLKLAQGTYLALLPADGAWADGATYRPGIYITVAAEFVGTDTGLTATGGEKHPLFVVKDVHVWGDEYTKAFGLPPWQPGRPTAERPVEPIPVWENPITP